MITTAFRLDNLVSAWFSAILKLSSRNCLCGAKMIIITMIITTVKKASMFTKLPTNQGFHFSRSV